MLSNWLIKYFKGHEGDTVLMKTKGVSFWAEGLFPLDLPCALRLASSVMRRLVTLLSAEGEGH